MLANAHVTLQKKMNQMKDFQATIRNLKLLEVT